MFTNNNYRLFVITLWLFWTAIHAIWLEIWGLPVTLVILDSVISNVGLIAGSIILIQPLKYYPEKNKLLMLSAITLVMTGIWYLATSKILPILPDATEFYREGLKESALLRFAIGFFLLFFSVLIRWFWIIGEEQRKLKDHHQETEQLARKTELKVLREQLHPHFLFNTLNSVSALIESEPKKARNMVFQLSDFLRGTMNKQDKLPVKFGEELSQIKLYLDIEKVRFGHRLGIEFNVSDDCHDIEMPTHLLQPLVENAVKFGLYDTTEDVCICLSATVDKNYLEVQIKNPFDTSTSEMLSGTGFGQQSVQRRLYLIYARTDLFSTTTNNNHYIVTLKIPL